MRLEFVEGASRKFWEARLQGRELVVRWGRIGSSGQTTTHTFGDETAARAERDKLVRKKTRKGYAIVEHDVDAPAPAAVAEAKLPASDAVVVAVHTAAAPSPATEERTAQTAPRVTAARARERAATLEPTKRSDEGVVTWTLFRGDGAAREFFEVSAAGREIEVARGKIGRAGRVREITLEPGEDVPGRVQREIAKALVDGFATGTDDVPMPDVPDAEAPIRRRAEALFNRHARTGYVPTVVEDGEGAPLDSRFGGRPALARNEPAPRCGRCEKPYTLIAQLRHDALPAAAQRVLAPALIQLFWCDTLCQAEDGWEPFSPSHLARAIAIPREPRFPLASEMPEHIYGAKRITGWTPVETYPGSEELRDLTQDDALADYALDLRDEESERYGSRPGERLLGWPAWIQGVEVVHCRTCRVAMDTVLQVDTGRTLREIGFGDSGIAWMLACPRCRAMTFTWQSC